MVYNGGLSKITMIEFFSILGNKVLLLLLLVFGLLGAIRPLTCVLATLIIARNETPAFKLKVLKLLCRDRVFRIGCPRNKDLAASRKSR